MQFIFCIESARCDADQLPQLRRYVLHRWKRGFYLFDSKNKMY